MDQLRDAPTLGILGSMAVIAVLLAPYLIVDPGAVGTYYTTGDVNPGVAGVFAIVALVVFAGGREERSDPNLAAGVGLVLGMFVVALAAVWALTVPESVVGQLGRADVLQYHRWVLVAVGSLLPAAGLWYARALRLF